MIRLLLIFFCIIPHLAIALDCSETLVYRGLRSEDHSITFNQPVEADFDSVVLLVTGPRASAKIWRKEKKFGIWTNKRSYVLSYYNSVNHIYSSAPLPEVTTPFNISFLNLDTINQQQPDDLYGFFLKKQFENGFFKEVISEFSLNNGWLSKQIILPSNIPAGQYKAYIYLFKDKNLTCASQSGFVIKNKNLIDKINRLAISYPLLYSLIAIFIALLLGGISAYIVPIIRKMKR